MSDSCLYDYELEDNAWDEFGASDDHIVPHPSKENDEQFAIQGERRKKPRHEVIDIKSIANNTSICGIQGKEENDLPFMTKKERVLEMGSWSQTPDDVFPASCDSGTVKEVKSAASDDIGMSIHGSKTANVDEVGELPVDDPILVDRCASAADDDNLYGYPLNHISQTDNDLSFLDNNREDKESSELLDYGWPDIGNFEDVDRMFRSCDSTFGLGSLDNEDDMCWFSSTNAAEESEDLLNSGPKLNSLSEHQEFCRVNGACPSLNDSEKKNLVASDKINFKPSDTDDSALDHLSFGNASDTQSENKNGSTFNEQINLHKNQLKHQNKSEGKRKDRHAENGGSFHQYANMVQFADMKHTFGDSSPQVFPSAGPQQHEQNIGFDSLSFMQTHIPYIHQDYPQSSDQISVCTVSGTKSENNRQMSPSPKNSSYASNQVQSMDSSHGLSFEAPTVTHEKKEKLFHFQDLQAPFTRNSKHVNTVSSMAFNSPSAQKQVHQSELDIEGHGEVEGVSIGVPAELDCSNAQESSVLDEISLEATSFRQLQQVTEKLDIRTKLCIRDSLYRLARSAEQRHCANFSGNITDDRDASGALMADGTNKCAGFIDMETDTNPIDRSIAHLLFHRPSDPSAHAKNALHFKSHATVHGSISSPPMKGEKQVCPEDATIDASKKLLACDVK